MDHPFTVIAPVGRGSYLAYQCTQEESPELKKMYFAYLFTEKVLGGVFEERGC